MGWGRGAGSCYVTQAGLELLDSSDPPVSASQSVKITGMSHGTQDVAFFLKVLSDKAVSGRRLSLNAFTLCLL